MSDIKIIEKLKKNIKKKNDQISLLQVVLKKIRELQQKKSKKLEDMELLEIEDEMKN